MIRRVRALALSTLAEAVRSQVFLNLGLFALLAVGGAVVLDQLALGDRGRVLLDLGVTALSIVDALLVTFMTVRTLGGEEDRRALLTILVRPVTRSEVLVGKFLGLAALVAINIAVALFVLALGMMLVGAVDITELMTTGLGLFVEASLLTAVTLMFATFTGSTVTAILGLGTYLCGLFAGELRNFAGKDDAGPLGVLVRGFYYAVPNLQRLDFHSARPSVDEMLLTLLYAALYAGAALALGCFIFERRDLK